MAEQTTSVEDMLRLETTALSKLREEMKEDREQREEERKEVHRLTDLLKEEIREYDRLSERASIQLKALMHIVDELKKV